MYLQELVEVFIGLIFAWLVLSIATMQIQEWIATYLDWRAKDMKSAIRNMLGDPAWAEQLYSHPLIQALGEKTNSKPSYIPADKFAVALFDIVATSGTEASIIQKSLHQIQNELDLAPNALWPLIKHVTSRWGGNIIDAATRFWNFVADAKIPTEKEKYQELLTLAAKATSSEASMRKFLECLTSGVQAKDSSGQLLGTERFSAEQFIKDYPGLEKIVASIYTKLTKDERETNLVKQLDKIKSLIQEKVDPGNPLSGFKLSLSDILTFENNVDEIFAKVQGGMTALRETNPGLHRALASLASNVQGTANNPNLMQSIRNIVGDTASTITVHEKLLANARTEVETWFDDVMARTQGWYKRKALVWAFFISLVAAIIMNVDSIDITMRLWREPALRQATASYVAEWAQQADPTKLQNQDIEKLNQELKALQVPIGWNIVQYTGKAECAIPAKPDQEVGFYMPFSNRTCMQITNPPKNTSEIFLKFLGILVSALAAMHGAPFWFDILKKLVNVRGVGANPVEEPKARASRGDEQGRER